MKVITVWFTGLPCSGKTNIADKLAIILKEKDTKSIGWMVT
jgi:adenylylsulfate kinase-like enzyme